MGCTENVNEEQSRASAVPHAHLAVRCLVPNKGGHVNACSNAAAFSREYLQAQHKKGRMSPFFPSRRRVHFFGIHTHARC
jgi:hypothetical protein